MQKTEELRRIVVSVSLTAIVIKDVGDDKDIVKVRNE